MPELKPQVSFLTEEEVDTTPLVTDTIPATTAPIVVPKKEEIVETPEAKTLREQKEKALLEKTKPATTIPLLTEEEVEVVPETETGGEKPGKKLSEKDIEGAIDYKALIEAKIETGAWEKWSNWDEIKDKTEFTPELYLELEKEQFDAKVDAKFQEEKQALPARVQEITDFIKNGGKEEELYASYEQELDIEALDPTKPEDAETIVKAHCEATGWSDKKTENYINGLKNQGNEALKEASIEAKEALVSVVKEERQEKIDAKAREKEQKVAYAETFNRKLREAIYTRTDIPEREKKLKEKFLFDYKNIDPDTKLKTSDFGMKWKEIVTDPGKYEKFIDFVQNFDKFENKENTEKKVITATHNFLRGSQSELGKNTNTQTPELQKQGKKSNYLNLFKKLGS